MPPLPSTPPRKTGVQDPQFSSPVTHLDPPGSWATFRSPPNNVTYSDRFIPSRGASARSIFSALDRDAAEQEAAAKPQAEESSAAYTALLRQELLNTATPTSARDGPVSPLSSPIHSPSSPSASPARRMLQFQSGVTAGNAVGSAFNTSPVGREPPPGVSLASPKKAPRRISRSPFKVLDAPLLQDDFYLNLVDWSSQNILAVGLGSSVYLWSAFTSKVTKLCDLGTMPGEPETQETMCSVGWSQRGTFLALGTSSGETQIWDISKAQCVRTMSGHRQRVGAIAWGANCLSTGSRDRSILQRDIRAPAPYHDKLSGHRSEVCGLEWSPDDRELASGGNDNQLLVWGSHGTQPQLRFAEHSAAVKAISWSPHQHGLLASGGGTADRCIRFWNTVTGSAINHVDTGSQVCNLSWSKNVNELVSTHGYSQNQIIVWRCPNMTKLATLTGHTMRVLYLASSPDGQTVVTGAGDETLRFWNVFPGAKRQATAQESYVGSLMRTHIR